MLKVHCAGEAQMHSPGAKWQSWSGEAQLKSPHLLTGSCALSLTRVSVCPHGV